MSEKDTIIAEKRIKEEHYKQIVSIVASLRDFLDAYQFEHYFSPLYYQLKGYTDRLEERNEKLKSTI